MSRYVLQEVLRMEHEERIRKAERDRLFVEVYRAQKRPSALKSLLLRFTRQ